MYLRPTTYILITKRTIVFKTFDKVNGLNDTDIEFIAWNNVAKCLVIAYSDQNIDLLTQKGEIISLSDYYRKTMTANKKNK